jgi:hypothetical protein
MELIAPQATAAVVVVGQVVLVEMEQAQLAALVALVLPLQLQEVQ